MWTDEERALLREALTRAHDALVELLGADYDVAGDLAAIEAALPLLAKLDQTDPLPASEAPPAPPP